MTNLLQSIKILVLAVILSIGVSYVYAWSDATQSPTGENALPPINVGATGQTKTGGLWLGSLGADGGATIGGSMRVGYTSATCTSGIAGTLRYNSGIAEYCNGSSWCALGTTCGINLVISSNTNNYNIYDAAVAAGWTAGKTVTLTVNSGVVVGSTNAGSPALTTGAFPAGTSLTIINNGSIIGAGGAGGTGVGEYMYLYSPWQVMGPTPWTLQNGNPGGNALNLTIPVIIDNTNGNVFGGGGGGGGGQLIDSDGVGDYGGPHAMSAGGGGGGGAGSNGGAGGGGGTITGAITYGDDGIGFTNGNSGQSGGSTGGAGGAGNRALPIGYFVNSGFWAQGGAGGNGGGYGQTGSSGNTGSGAAPGGGLFRYWADGLPYGWYGRVGTQSIGGSAGKAINTNSNIITWLGGNNSTQVKGAAN